MKTEINIEEFLSLSDYATEERSEYRQRSGGTQNIFQKIQINIMYKECLKSRANYYFIHQRVFI